MEYKPRYSQPFTLEEARQLPVPIITEEISRLQNSLSHLQRTQDELKEALTTSPDDLDLTQAFEENEVVIGSQQERVSILRMVLTEKGITMGAHYDPPAPHFHQPTTTGPPQEGVPQSESTIQTNGHAQTPQSSGAEDEDGVFL